MAEFREVIERIGDSFKQQESKKLARALQNNLYRNIKHENKDIVSWGIKTAPFVLLLATDMPSVLAEVSTLTNLREEKRLSTHEYRDKIAQYLEAGIVEYLDNIRSLRGPIIGATENAENQEES